MGWRWLAGLIWRAVTLAPCALGADMALPLAEGALAGVQVGSLAVLGERRTAGALALWAGSLVLAPALGQLRALLTHRAQQRAPGPGGRLPAGGHPPAPRGLP